MKLEEELGVRLFDRLGRTVRLTGFGQVFLPRARAIRGSEDIPIRVRGSRSEITLPVLRDYELIVFE